MKSKMLCWLSVGLMLSGCGKPAETPAPNSATAATENPASQSSGPTADLTALTGELRGWIITNRRLPASFEEFATSTKAKIPPPPSGKKYAIDKSTVILVNR